MPWFRRAPFIIGTIALIALLGAGALVWRMRSTSKPTADLGARLIFAEFSTNSDRVYIAPATDPAQRTTVTTIEHVAEWGINPAIAPVGTLVAYNVLPTTTVNAQADSPAELWTLDVATGAKTRLAGDADLRVPPVFDAKGTQLVYRSSASGGKQSLIRIDIPAGTRRPLYEAETAFGMFPVGFSQGALVFATLSSAGTDFFSVLGGAPPTMLFHASDQLARDWRISPSGDSLAYLAPVISAERVAYRLHVAKLTGGPTSPTRLGGGDTEQYGNAWRPGNDAVTVGQQPATSGYAGAQTLPLANSSSTTLTPPPRGFDQPLGWSLDGTALAARSFDGMSSAAPGRETTVVIDAGQRRVVSGSGDIIYFGWMPSGSKK
ncbi:MAG: hypothetical protein DWI48_01340 [Chloroflexi bacterium]|nr:MAG: hypothetical protein DWI48_01340 [Chloroflexota bacterium]